ncbi:MAG: response regulator [Opitutaceae bacterium]|nr:response regulator [Opitutaceae bacterium]
MTPGQSQTGGRGPVLLVDDEPALLNAMKEGLEADFAVETAASAAEAERLMAARPYAVVICDHVMPGEEGLGFLVRMRDRHPQVRRILLTGYLNPELLSRAIAVAELSACLLKPANAAQLAQAVRTAVMQP